MGQVLLVVTELEVVLGAWSRSMGLRWPSVRVARKLLVLLLYRNACLSVVADVALTGVVAGAAAHRVMENGISNRNLP